MKGFVRSQRGHSLDPPLVLRNEFKNSKLYSCQWRSQGCGIEEASTFRVKSTAQKLRQRGQQVLGKSILFQNSYLPLPQKSLNGFAQIPRLTQSRPRRHHLAPPVATQRFLRPCSPGENNFFLLLSEVLFSPTLKCKWLRIGQILNYPVLG